MSDAVVTALITGGFTLMGVVISNMLSARKTEAAMRVSQAVTDTKIEELTREVREHNRFAQRMPVVEHDILDLQRRVVILENYHKQPVREGRTE